MRSLQPKTEGSIRVLLGIVLAAAITVPARAAEESVSTDAGQLDREAAGALSGGLY